MKLGEYLKAYRERHGLSMRALADLCGFSKAYINILEKGVNPKTGKPISPTIQAFEKIAAATKTDVDTLLKILDSDQPITVPAPASVSDQHSPRDLNDLARFLNKTEIMFDGDTYRLDEDDRQKLRNALEFVFWDAKQQNKRKKKAPKKITGADSSTREETPDTAALIGKKILAASSKAQVAIDQIIRNDEKE